MLDLDTCYRALSARDARFDGVFYVGVKTTGVYCRPICPARTPRRSSCEFFVRADAAERAGFRACFRCRPELAPGPAPVDALPRLVEVAVARIEAGYLNDHSIDELAASLSVTARHLRRAIESELGVAPLQIAQTRRLGLAKQLLANGVLSVTEVAFAAGFGSVRRFNAACRAQLSKAPSELRREPAHEHAAAPIVLRLDYRPPLAWDELLAFLGARAIPGVERVERGAYLRSVALDGCRGWIEVRKQAARDALEARVALSLAPKLMPLAARLRAVFDLDARPEAIAEQLCCDARFARLVATRPGLRVPGAFDGFELAVRAILGQQVSVRAATTLAGRLVARFGQTLETPWPGIDREFPEPSALAAARALELRAIGLTEARARTLIELARALLEGRIALAHALDPEQAVRALERLPGVGPWTAQYIAMRALRWPDAFPASDLAVRKALGVTHARAAEASAERLRPWRAYAVMHLWSSLAEGGDA